MCTDLTIHSCLLKLVRFPFQSEYLIGRCVRRRWPIGGCNLHRQVVFFWSFARVDSIKVSSHITFFIPHRSTTYADAAIVTDGVSLSVCLSVCLSVTIVSPAKTAEPIEMPFGLWSRVGPRSHVLDGGQDPPNENAQI